MTINNSLIMPLVDDSVSLVKVRFLNDTRTPQRDYIYKYRGQTPANIGDLCIVEASSSYTAARIVDVGVVMPMENTTTTFRWVAGIINMDHYRHTVRMEKHLQDNLRSKRAGNARDQLRQVLGLDTEAARTAMLTEADQKASDTAIPPRAMERDAGYIDDDEVADD